MKIAKSNWISALISGVCLLYSLNLRGADLSATYDWKQMKIGGGGWVVGMDISPTEKDLIYARTDVSGAYRWNPTTSTWKQIVTADSLPKEYVGYGKYTGVDSLVSAPKDPNIAYMAFNKQIFKSTNRGDTWAATTFANNNVKMDANGEGRQEGERLGVDPHNSDVVYFCPTSDFLWYTNDGGVNWHKVEGIPVGKPPHGINTVIFDKESGTTKSKTGATKTNVIYVTAEEAGVFKSSDAGKTWVNIAASGPGIAIKPRDAEIGPDRTYYLATDKGKDFVGSLWKCSPAGEWTDITPPAPQGGNQSYADVAVDPADAKHIVLIQNGGKCFVSKDQGATWTFHTFHLNSPNIQWLGKQQHYWLSVGEIVFDPFEPGKLWFAEGFGVWWTKDLTPKEIPWQAASEGIEEACGNEVIAPPGGKPVAAMWDIGVFYFSDPDTYTAKRSHPYFMAAWALDWCASDPKFLVGVFRNNLGFPPHIKDSGYSTDGGQTWTKFPAVAKGTLPAELEYGAIAVSANNPDHIVWAPAFKKMPHYTTDRGATWLPVSLGGPVGTGIEPLHSGQKPICADRVLPDTFYFYRPKDGVYRSTDGGANFTKVGSPVVNPAASTMNNIMKATPGHAKDLWFSEGGLGGLWHSTDGGDTWAQIPGIQQSFNVGLGKSQKDGGYPTLYMDGIIKGETGIYRSTDVGATWDKICTYPLGVFGWVDALDGDKEVFGKIYIGFAQDGFAYGAIKKP